MRNILFIGGAGFIGSNLIGFFANNPKYRIFVFEPTFANLSRLTSVEEQVTIII